MSQDRAGVRSFSFYGYVIATALIAVFGVLLVLFTPQLFAGVPDGPSHIPPTPDLAWYRAVVMRTRIFGLGVVVAALIGLLLQARLRPVLADLLSDGWDMLTTSPQRWWKTWAEESFAHKLILYLIVLTGIVVRVLVAGQAFTNDEARAFNDFANQPLLTSLSDYAAPANHVFQTVLTHFAVNIFGNYIFVIRLPALIPGLLLPIGVYILGRRLYNKRTGLLAATLVGVSSYLIDLSAEARGYSLVTLATVMLVLIGLALLEKPRRALWFMYAVTAALGFFAIPTMLFPFAGITVWFGLVLLIRHQWGLYIRSFAFWTVFTGLLTIGLYTPVLIFSGINVIIANDYVKPGSLSDTLSGLLPFLNSVWTFTNFYFLPSISIMLGLGAIVGLLAYRSRTYATAYVTVVLLICGILLIFVERRIPYERVWTYMFPFYYLVCSAGICFVLENIEHTRFGRQPVLLRLVMLAALAVIGLSPVMGKVSQLASNEFFPEADQVAHYLAREWHPGDQVFARYPTRAVTIYYLDLMGRRDIVFSKQGQEAIDSGKRFLLLIDQTLSPWQMNVKTTFNSGDPVVPKLLYSYNNARVYEIIAPHPSP